MYLVEIRGLSNYYHVKIGIDGSGGFLKLCINIVDKVCLPTKNELNVKDSGLKKL